MIHKIKLVRAWVCAALLCSGTALAEDRVGAGALKYVSTPTGVVCYPHYGPRESR